MGPLWRLTLMWRHTRVNTAFIDRSSFRATRTQTLPRYGTDLVTTRELLSATGLIDFSNQAEAGGVLGSSNCKKELLTTQPPMGESNPTLTAPR
jgi:hypothetical protein